MKQRLKRIQRLIELRERETHQEVASLRFAQHAENVARQDEEQARQRLAQAEMRRRALATQTSSVVDYIAFEDWLETLAIKHTSLLKALQAAVSEVARVTARVRQARQKEKQVRLLLERLELEQRSAQARRERRQEDEFAQNMVLARRNS